MNFVGQGLSYPFKLTKGTVPLTSGADLINSSLSLLFSYDVGSRFFESPWGSNLYKLIEEPNDHILQVLARDYIIQAITDFEKRINLLEVNFYNSNEALIAECIFIIKETNEVDNFVFPFYTKTT